MAHRTDNCNNFPPRPVTAKDKGLRIVFLAFGAVDYNDDDDAEEQLADENLDEEQAGATSSSECDTDMEDLENEPAQSKGDAMRDEPDLDDKPDVEVLDDEPNLDEETNGDAMRDALVAPTLTKKALPVVSTEAKGIISLDSEDDFVEEDESGSVVWHVPEVAKLSYRDQLLSQVAFIQNKLAASSSSSSSKEVFEPYNVNISFASKYNHSIGVDEYV